MPFNQLLSSLPLVSLERKQFVWKIDNEIRDNACLAIPDLENRKEYFLQLVDGNKQLSEIEKNYCRERYTYDFELMNALYKKGEPFECEKCKSIRYSNKYCENCISLHLQSLFNTWSSGNDIIDNFIQQCQIKSSLPGRIMEWIPYDQFEDVKKLTEGGFSSIYTATWTEGDIVDYDEKKKEFSYFEKGQMVILKCLKNSSDPGKVFFDEVGSF